MSIVRVILSLAAALCVLWSPPASFTPAGAEAAFSGHGHDHDADDRHAGHHHEGTAADHSHDSGAAAAFLTPHLYAGRPGWYGLLSVLADPGWPNALERPPRAAAES